MYLPLFYIKYPIYGASFQNLKSQAQPLQNVLCNYKCLIN